jgi:hypothetical protein
VDEVRERLSAVDENDRDTLSVAPLELVVAGDVDLLELERNLGADLGEHTSGALAEVALRRVVEGDGPFRGRAHA